MKEPIRMPFFSVLVPVYQSAHVVRGALESVFTQTFSDSEVIACDDGSTDGPEAVFRNYPGLIVVKQENRGVAAARNHAASAAHGVFLAFLDADDTWHRDYLRCVRDYISAHPTVDLIGVNGEYIVRGRAVRKLHATLPIELLEHPRAAILVRNRLFLPVVRAALFHEVGGFDDSLRRLEDWDCWIRMILAGGEVGYVDKPLLHYRYSPLSLRQDGLKMRIAELAVVEKASNAILSAEDSAILANTRERIVAAIAVDRAREALWQRRSDVRQLCLSVARDRRQRVTHRVGFLFAATAPRLFRAVRTALRSMLAVP